MNSTAPGTQPRDTTPLPKARVTFNNNRFAALARQLADAIDAGQVYTSIVHEIVLTRHIERTGQA